jgi:hypothetical protein
MNALFKIIAESLLCAIEAIKPLISGMSFARHHTFLPLLAHDSEVCAELDCPSAAFRQGSEFGIFGDGRGVFHFVLTA